MCIRDRYKGLLQVAANKFNLNPTTITIKYKDDDEDYILVNCDDDVSGAIQFYKGKTPKFLIISSDHAKGLLESMNLTDSIDMDQPEEAKEPVSEEI